MSPLSSKMASISIITIDIRDTITYRKAIILSLNEDNMIAFLNTIH